MERLVPHAVDMGMDLLVVDDGWFGSNSSTGAMRNDDSCCLGDWYHNPAKLPAGLSGLAKEVNAAGLNLGIWMEPEMVGREFDGVRVRSCFACSWFFVCTPPPSSNAKRET